MMKMISFILLVSSTVLSGQTDAHGDLRKGEKQYDQKNYPGAETAYSKASGNPAALYNAGNAAYQQAKFDLAAEYFKSAAALFPNSPARSDAYYNLGNSYLKLGKYQEAIVVYEKSLRLQTNRPDAKKNLQIAKNKAREKEDPPPPPPPPQNPPPPPPPRNNYVDRAQAGRKREVASGTMTAALARQKLNAVIDQEEQKNARQYRSQPPEARPDRKKKDW
jgi:tetratricopeptide (TPR) repeat protein